MLKRLPLYLLLFTVFAAAYLVAWPVDLHPVVWDAPEAPALSGPYAPNDRLHGVERVMQGIALGPEATAIDAQGRVVTGTRHGGILRFDPATSAHETIATIPGRPLGMTYDAAGNLLVCGELGGLLSVSPTGDVRPLSREQGGVPFRFTNDVAVGPDGTVYFTDASSRYGISEIREDILEHGGYGRLLAYRPIEKDTKLLAGGLQFANGVAVVGDGSFLVFAETGAYKLSRCWLTGPRRGAVEPFVENLPGLPDNVTWSPGRRVFWVALFSPRVPALDLLSGWPSLRKVAYRLPLKLQPQPEMRAWALAIDEQGKVVENLQDGGPDAFAPVTSVRESRGYLWLGSLERDALGRIKAP